MSERVLLRGVAAVMRSLTEEFMAAIEGIPDDELNTWKPAAEQNGGGDMNTFSALGVHTASAGRWMIFHQAFGHDVPRDRESEFHATATRDEIAAGFAALLADLDREIESGTLPDFTAMPPTIRQSRADWNRATWLMHAVDHTGLHVGHVQIMRQVWLAERSSQA